MDLFTIGFTQKSAEQFFELIKKHKIELLLDIRLNNKSQLAGFTKGSDLKYFLAQISECQYEHCIDCAPTKEILDAYKKGQISWEDYERLYLPLMEKRRAVELVLKKAAQYERSVYYVVSQHRHSVIGVYLRNWLLHSTQLFALNIFDFWR